MILMTTLMISSFAMCSIDNAEKLKLLESHKQGFLFTSDNLISLLDLIVSKKTQISIIESIGPRLTDPKTRSEDIIGRFRFAEEKRIVQEVLKMRAQTLNCSMYGTPRTATPMQSNFSQRVPPAGRILGGRGPGLRRAMSARKAALSEPPLPKPPPSRTTEPGRYRVYKSVNECVWVIMLLVCVCGLAINRCD